jgi:hypothetical protein
LLTVGRQRYCYYADSDSIYSQITALEKEKLQLTAAFIFRKKNRIHAHCESKNWNDKANSEQQMTTYSLLNASKEQLMKSIIATVVPHINAIMQELHGIFADL